MKQDITITEHQSSAPASGTNFTVDSSKYSSRTSDYPKTLLTWDEKATRGLTREEQRKVYKQLRHKFDIGEITFYSDKSRDPTKTLMLIKAAENKVGWKRDFFCCGKRSAGAA